MSETARVAEGDSGHPPPSLDGEPPQPPSPPELSKRWRFSRHQLVGIPLMLLIVGAAMLGYFGKSETTASAERGGIQLTVDYVSKIRHRMVGPLDVTMTNSSPDVITGVTLLIDRGYLTEFSGVVFTPTPTYLTADWAAFELGDLAPGESISISGEVQSEGFGRHDGQVRALAYGAEPLVAEISTLSFP